MLNTKLESRRWVLSFVDVIYYGLSAKAGVALSFCVKRTVLVIDGLGKIVIGIFIPCAAGPRLTEV